MSYCIISQGSTYNFPNSIYEYKYFNKKILYTAMSRSTNKSNINFIDIYLKSEVGYIYIQLLIIIIKYILVAPIHLTKDGWNIVDALKTHHYIEGSSRGDARRTLRWLWNFLPDEVWDAETTRKPATAARQPRASTAGVSPEEYDSDLLGIERPTRMPPGLTQSPRREAPTRAGHRSNRVPGPGRRQLLKLH